MGMAGSIHREREIANASIRCQNRIRFESERLKAMAKKTAELDEYLNSQGIFERVIKELNGKNAEIRARKKENETIMTRCLQEIAEQIARQNWILGDELDLVASQMGAGSDRDRIQELANAYHRKNT
jgi:adenylyl- and sulfurtransferase ThiI